MTVSIGDFDVTITMPQSDDPAVQAWLLQVEKVLATYQPLQAQMTQESVAQLLCHGAISLPLHVESARD